MEKSSEEETRFKCPLCLDRYRDPRILPCIHTFCRSCLENYLNETCSSDLPGTIFHCPLCRAKQTLPSEGIAGIKKNIYLEALKTSAYPLCDKHPIEDLRFYCRNCDIEICRDCKTISHEGHAIDLIKTVFEEAKRNFQESLNLTERVIDDNETELREAVVQELLTIQTLMSTTKRRADLLKTEIDNFVQDVEEVIRSHLDSKTQTLMNIEERSNERRRTLNRYRQLSLISPERSEKPSILTRLCKEMAGQDIQSMKQLRSLLKPSNVLDAEMLEAECLGILDVSSDAIDECKKRISSYCCTTGMPTEVMDVVPWTEPGANGDGSEEQRGQWQQNNTNISLKNTGGEEEAGKTMPSVGVELLDLSLNGTYSDISGSQSEARPSATEELVFKSKSRKITDLFRNHASSTFVSASADTIFGQSITQSAFPSDITGALAVTNNGVTFRQKCNTSATDLFGKSISTAAQGGELVQVISTASQDLGKTTTPSASPCTGLIGQATTSTPSSDLCGQAVTSSSTGLSGQFTISAGGTGSFDHTVSAAGVFEATAMTPNCDSLDSPSSPAFSPLTPSGVSHSDFGQPSSSPASSVGEIGTFVSSDRSASGTARSDSGLGISTSSFYQCGPIVTSSSTGFSGQSTISAGGTGAVDRIESAGGVFGTTALVSSCDSLYSPFDSPVYSPSSPSSVSSSPASSAGKLEPFGSSAGSAFGTISSEPTIISSRGKVRFDQTTSAGRVFGTMASRCGLLYSPSASPPFSPFSPSSGSSSIFEQPPSPTGPSPGEIAPSGGSTFATASTELELGISSSGSRFDVRHEPPTMSVSGGTKQRSAFGKTPGSLLATEGAKTFDSASTTSTDGVISRGDCGLTGGWINLDKWSSFIGLSSGELFGSGDAFFDKDRDFTGGLYPSLGFGGFASGIKKRSMISSTYGPDRKQLKEERSRSKDGANPSRCRELSTVRPRSFLSADERATNQCHGNSEP